MAEIISSIFIWAGIICMSFGVLGIFKLESFYLRILVSSKVDTVGALTLIIGLAIRHGLSYFSGKLLLLIFIMLILNPLVAHTIARGAYTSGHKIDENRTEEKI
ncbi:MAG: monovalent cation/H(+) antiporter subunit G [Oscillospiraceae bacterium]|nr:monovalent cation/H(+) antiporter subunit G [Oscillospiraceae bacterium]